MLSLLFFIDPLPTGGGMFGCVWLRGGESVLFYFRVVHCCFWLERVERVRRGWGFLNQQK